MNENMGFERRLGVLYAEEVPIPEIVKSVGTPCYIYAQSALIDHYKAFVEAFSAHPSMICFAVKSNPHLAVLQTLAQQQAGFDIVSGGELARVLKAGGNPRRVVFSGIGKTEEEMRFALQQGIYCFNVESEPELKALLSMAQQLNLKAPIALRVNPNVDPQSHPHFSTGLKTHKFGIPIEEALPLYQTLNQHPHAQILGVTCHIGSQITSLGPFEEAFNSLFTLISQLKAIGIPLRHVDIGGGLGTYYGPGQAIPPTLSDYASLVLKACPADLMLICEPGRAIAASPGILVTQLLYLKSMGDKQFGIVDAGMTDLVRPAFYEAYHDIVPVIAREGPPRRMDVVGPVCESSDYLGKDRLLTVKPGDLLAVLDTGAYGFTLSSHYNSRLNAAEVMVCGKKYQVIRPRETIEELMVKECFFS